jgi:outer membrane cobalamin receptor
MKYRRHLVFGLVVVAYAVYVFALFWRSSAVIDGERYFALGDDAMISMRYARNFAHGHGLVWNVGGSWSIKGRVEVFGRIENLFDRSYEEAFGFPALGRSAMAGVRVAASR